MKKTIKVITFDGNLKRSNTVHTDSLAFEVARAMAVLQQKSDAPSCLSTVMIIYELSSNLKYQKYNTRVSNAKLSGKPGQKTERRMVHGSLFRLSRVGLLDTYKPDTYKIDLDHKVEVAGKVMTFKEYTNSLEAISTNLTPKIFPRQSSFLKGDEINYPAANDRATRIEKILTPLINTDETYLLSYSYNIINNTITTCSKLKEKKNEKTCV